jgi:hypothetical protein
MEDGTNDKFCVKCSKKAKQAMAALPLGQATAASLIQPMLRETIVINTGDSNLGKVSVYKDEILREINKQLCIGTNFLK